MKMNELHDKLEEILGSKNVYLRPPSKGMKYPAIKYEFLGREYKMADNKKYIKFDKYRITVIDENPNSDIPEKIENLDYCNYDRTYISDGLNHFVYVLYF